MMNSKHSLIKQLIASEGIEFLLERKLYNILTDMEYFKDCGKTRYVFNAIVENNMAMSIIDYFRGNIRKNELLTFIPELESNYDVQDISYSLQCIFYALGTIDGVEDYTDAKSLDWLGLLAECTNTNDAAEEDNTEYVIIKITPQEADVRIDSRRYHTTCGEVVKEVSHGTHNFEVSSELYHTYRGTFQISDNQNTTIEVDLKPNYGCVLLLSNASNATAYIDDKEIGTTPITVNPLKSGTHTIKVKHPFYKDYTQIFELHDEEKRQINAELSPNYGDVLLFSDDPELAIIVDGEEKGRKEWLGTLIAGKHIIECKKESFHGQTLVVDIKPSHEVQEIELPELEACYGNLKINVIPSGSYVYLDGVKIGTTPLRLKKIRIGSHVVRVTDDNKNLVEKKIEIEEGKTTEIEDTIEKLFFTDFSQIQIGDFYYEDGSFSRKKSVRKEAIGVVFSLSVSLSEKLHGWTHGHIMSLKNCSSGGSQRTDWSQNGLKVEDLPFHIFLRTAAKENNDGYSLSHQKAIERDQNLNAYQIARSFKPSLDPVLTSGWYLPSVGQWQEALENLLGISLTSGNEIRTRDIDKSLSDNLKLLGIVPELMRTYWTGSQYDNKSAWVCQYDNFSGIIKLTVQQKTFTALVRAVAAF